MIARIYDINVNYSEFIKQHREKIGMTQYELADKTGILRQTITAYELGINKKPPYDKLVLIAKTIGADSKELLRLAGYPVEGQTEKDKIVDELTQCVDRMKELVNKLRNNT